MNSLFTITIYRSGNSWCFDDELRGLLREPFVLGTSEMIDALIHHNMMELDREGRYGLTFSTGPFPGWSGSISRGAEEYDGYWYALDGSAMSGWLCPATRLFFGEHPEKIYLAVDRL